MIKQFNAQKARLRRHQRVRKHVYGTAERPRLAVFRSAKHIYAQLINDEEGITLVSASSIEKDLPKVKNPSEEELAKHTGIHGIAENRKVLLARTIGNAVAKRALEKGISKVVFDRGGYVYHGRIAGVAAGAREAGLDF